MRRYLAAAVQISSSADRDRNWRITEELIERAAGFGARLISTPENTVFLGDPLEKARSAETLEGRTCTRFASLAARLKIHLVLGSFNELALNEDCCFNTSVLFGPDGNRLGAYRKIHLFDIDLAPEVRFEESAHVCSGDQVVAVETQLGKIGFAICYDLRFSDHFRRLREDGAELVVVPSAFTVPTGRAHWQPLLRARAIEEQVYVIAAAQWGRHDEDGSRESYGCSAIVDPWGCVLARAADGEGLALAEIDLDRVDSIRSAMPVAMHRAGREAAS